MSNETIDFPRAPATYNERDQKSLRRLLKEALDRCYKRGENLEMDRNASVIMTAPNGTRYKMTVSNAGATVWTAI